MAERQLWQPRVRGVGREAKESRRATSPQGGQQDVTAVLCKVGTPVLPQTADLKDHNSSIFTTTFVLLIAGIKSSRRMSGHVQKTSQCLTVLANLQGNSLWPFWTIGSRHIYLQFTSKKYHKSKFILLHLWKAEISARSLPLSKTSRDGKQLEKNLWFSRMRSYPSLPFLWVLKVNFYWHHCNSLSLLPQFLQFRKTPNAK